VITVRTGTTCHIKGAKKLLDGLRKQLNLLEREDTTDDRKFTVDHVACEGTCSMAPVVLINKKVYGKITANKLSKEIETLRRKTGGRSEG